MKLSAIQVHQNDTTTINFIIENLLDSVDAKPTPHHFQKLLADDRTYLFAAILNDDIIGYALAYKFPSLYETSHLAYLYDIEVLETHRSKGAGIVNANPSCTFEEG